jgi:hypothetical protein
MKGPRSFKENETKTMEKSFENWLQKQGMAEHIPTFIEAGYLSSSDMISLRYFYFLFFYCHLAR